ncbi:hypothetical protein [Candidatus Uabimicrobium sp. HlEnr_7]|uniref:hypothetical protein n=1 Tax=Candidatus Uabimicrobium helgolandensis TaxID=3095367 RepID=UPI003557D193
MNLLRIIFFSFILLSIVFFTYPIDNEITSDIKAYKIELLENDTVGYRNRFFSFEEPRVENGVIEFNCAERGCKNIIHHDGPFRIHEVHIDKEFNVLE